MFTRCQGCHTVHPVNAALLARAGGRYRCGKCRKLNNALDALFDTWPDAGREAPGAGPVPELGMPLTVTPPLAAAESADAAADGNEAIDFLPAAPQSRPVLRLAWITGAIVLAIVLTFAVADFLGKPLLDRALIDTALIRTGLKESPPDEPFRDLARIELVNRELRSHPVRPGALQLTATIVNRASQAQAYPQVEVSLLGIGNEVIAVHRFDPGDYLASTAELRRGMTPAALLPFAVELPDPGEQAVGFELEFR